MTYKHASSFDQSEVMRELERIAIKKGQYNCQPEEMVKIASKKLGPTLEPSENLIIDLCRLADGLKHRGFAKQAKELEQKIVLYKKAQYNIKTDSPEELSDFAHRDGDVKITDATDELGVIETVQSAAKKLREVAQKNPKGGKDRVASAALSILKQAQKLEDTAEQQIGSALNEFISSKNNPPFNPQDVVFDNANWQDPQVQSLYEKYAGIPQGTVVKYNNIWQQLNSAGVMNGVKFWQDRYFRMLNSADFNRARTIATLLDGTLGTNLVNTYFTGVSTDAFGALSWSKSSKIPYNEKSVFYEDGLGRQRADSGATLLTTPHNNKKELATQAAAAWDSFYNKVWGNLKNANTALQSEIAKLINGIKNIPAGYKKLDASMMADGETVRAADAANIIGKIKNDLASVQNSSIANILSIFDKEKAASLSKWVTVVGESVKGLENTINQMTGGRAVPGLDGMISAATSAASKYQRLARNLSGADKENASENATSLRKMLKTIQTYGGSWPLLQSAIEKDFGNRFETPEELRGAIDSFLVSANAAEENIQGGR